MADTELGSFLKSNFDLEPQKGALQNLTARHVDSDSSLLTLEQRLAEQIKASHQAEYPLDGAGIKFTAALGVGSMGILKFPLLRFDGQGTHAFVAVHPDTDFSQGQLRLTMLGKAVEKTLWIPDKVDPLSSAHTLQDVLIRLSGVDRLDRGGHRPGEKVSIVQPVHMLTVMGAATPESRARATILKQVPSEQPHVGDRLQQRNGTGLIPFLSASTPEDSGRELLDDPISVLPAFSVDRPSRLVMVLNVALLDPKELDAGRISPIKANDPDAVLRYQELAFARIIMKGQGAVDEFARNVERRMV